MRATIDISQYKVSHWSKPRGDGRWLFENASTGEEVALTGRYSEVIRNLPAGRWIVLP